MTSKTAQATIAKLKMVFAQHGIPQVVTADNMPFSSREFKTFATSWNFQVVTSSPGYPQSNGLVECNVQTNIHLFKKAYDEGKDAEMSLLEFQNTPITGLDQPPAQLLMSRRLRSSLPMTITMFQPSIHEGTRERLKQRPQHQKCAYDRGAKPLASLQQMTL